MQSNNQLGYTEFAAVGNYTVGRKGKSDKCRAYGYEWHSEQDISHECAHHEVCGRGDSLESAVEAMIAAAIRAGRVPESGHNGMQLTGLTEAKAWRLRDELMEELAELV